MLLRLLWIVLGELSATRPSFNSFDIELWLLFTGSWVSSGNMSENTLSMSNLAWSPNNSHIETDSTYTWYSIAWVNSCFSMNISSLPSPSSLAFNRVHSTLANEVWLNRRLLRSWRSKISYTVTLYINQVLVSAITCFSHDIHLPSAMLQQ